MEQHISDAYVKILIQPYVDVMDTINDMEVFRTWVGQIFPEDVDDIVVDNIETAKSYFITHLLLELRYVIVERKRFPPERFLIKSFEDVTPWDIASIRDTDSTRIFGETQDKIPVTVVLNGNVFEHLMTEELAYGILLSTDDKVQLYIHGIPLSIESFQNKFLAEFQVENLFIPKTVAFEAIINNEHYIFSSPDFIQGIITGAGWMGYDPHTNFQSLSMIQGNHLVPINF